MSLHGKTMELTLTQYTEGKKEKQLCCFQQRAKIHWNKTIPCQLLVKIQPLLECSLPYVETQTGISAYSISKQEQNSISLLWNTSSLQTEIALKTFTKCCFWLTWLRGLARVGNICENVLGEKNSFWKHSVQKKAKQNQRKQPTCDDNFLSSNTCEHDQKEWMSAQISQQGCLLRCLHPPAMLSHPTLRISLMLCFSPLLND